MTTDRWLLLIHQIPARPLYLRARIRTLLARTGAVPLKNAVYALPARDGALEELDAVAREIRDAGGDAHVCDARFRAEDAERLIHTFNAQREAEYGAVRAAAARLVAEAIGTGAVTPRGLDRVRKQFERTRTLDAFGAPGRAGAEAAIARLASRRLPRSRGERARRASEWVGRAWVTRRGVHVDRIACAWFIRRFLDPNAPIRFVAGATAARAGELGFDLPGGAFTHEGGRCSFETLLARTGSATPALTRIAEIVHDLDLKDARYAHAETAGIERLIGGIVAAHAGDEARLERGAMLFDDLHRSLSGTPAPTLPAALATAARGARGPRPGRSAR